MIATDHINDRLAPVTDVANEMPELVTNRKRNYLH